jgi:hypothetical protein
VSTSAERKGANQVTFRSANERLERGARALLDPDEQDSLVPFLCECPREGCTQVVLVGLEEYEAVRAVATRGVEAVGHEDTSVERVVDRNERFVVTEKFGVAADVVSDTDPRGNG